MQKIFLGIAFLTLIACHSSTEKNKASILSSEVSTKTISKVNIYPKMDSLITLNIAGHLVDIRSPEKVIKGNILILPGWNFPRHDWCDKSQLCQKALAAGYRLILPEMGKSVYSSKFYPETRKDWQQFPTLTWVVDSLITKLQKEHKIFLSNQANFLLGLSTGGRGVAMIALKTPDLWKAGAALSGDFDQVATPQDRLMTGYYGSYYQFKDRWLGEDNPQQQVGKFKTPLYLGHGTLDKIVPVSQTKDFYNALKKSQPELILKLHLPQAGHDYAYWDSEVDNILKFFTNIDKK